MVARPTYDEMILIGKSRHAYLSTASYDGVPHLIPICFAFDGQYFYSAIDQKPKRAVGKPLKRVRNILSNPNVALLLDHYEEDWRRIWYLLVMGSAHVLAKDDSHTRAFELLEDKYCQYRAMDLVGSSIIRIIPSRFINWSGEDKRVNL